MGLAVLVALANSGGASAMHLGLGVAVYVTAGLALIGAVLALAMERQGPVLHPAVCEAV